MRLDKTQAALRRGIERLELRRAGRNKARKPKPRHTASAPKIVQAETGARGRSSNKHRHRAAILEQWIEVRIGAEGETITTRFPPDAVLFQNAGRMTPAPELVYRRIHFVDGVPREYLWATEESAIRLSGGLGIQRMTMETWRALTAREESEGNGHLLPTYNLPRPEERGGCDCRVCDHNRRLLRK